MLLRGRMGVLNMMRRRCLSSSVGTLNPLIGNMPSATAAVPAVSSDEPPAPRTARSHFRNLPVSPKKLVVVANLVKGLYVREAMLQLEFCRKNMGVMVKNAIDSAASNAWMHHGIDMNHLAVDQISVGKGSHFKKPDFKSKGRSGIRKVYFSHLLVILREVKPEDMNKLKSINRWKRAQKILSLPWEERVAQLPRYKPIEGYSPGVRRRPLELVAQLPDANNLTPPTGV